MTINPYEPPRPPLREKPPIGIQPHWHWMILRLEDLQEARQRYEEAGIEVPAAWENEIRWIIMHQGYRLSLLGRWKYRRQLKRFSMPNATTPFRPRHLARSPKS
ncbi:hypothetical protein [Rhodopirellula bahusiensis]|uniref:hypothetical protein n=1 Tax=Rhodopirellula bahusiensis TaxID=2014065 RepID=UPI00326629BE